MMLTGNLSAESAVISKISFITQWRFLFLPAFLALPVSADTIQWDNSTLQYLGPGGYGRIDRLSNGNLMLIKDVGGVTYTQVSTNNGTSWASQVKVASNPFGVATNGEILQLQNGSIIALWNDRPTDGVHAYDISKAISNDGGKTWGSAQTLYTAGTNSGQGCWEPAGLQLANGQVQVFFSNENPYPNNNDQEIDVVKSNDGGSTWSGIQQTSYRPGYRDGMPVPVILQNGHVVYSIEDPGLTGSFLFQPTIVDTTTSTRWGANNPALGTSVTSAAPYLRQFPTGQTVLSAQSNQFQSSVEQVVYVGDSSAHNFTNVTVPFAPDGGQEGLWNSLFIKNAYTVTAVTGTTIGGKSGLWAVNGYLSLSGPSYYFDTTANTTSIHLDAGNANWSPVTTIWAQQIASQTGQAAWSWGQGGTPGNAYFVADGSSVVTVGGAVQANSLTFYGTGYQVAGTTLTLVGSGQLTSTLTGAGSPVINAPITSTVALNKTGPGDVTLGGNVTALDVFVHQGLTTISSTGSVGSLNFSSIGQVAGDMGSMTVQGTFGVNGDLNVADVNATGQLNIVSGAVTTKTLHVGKYGTSFGSVLQTGGSINSLAGGGDWRIGGEGSSADAGAVGTYQLQGGTFGTSDNFQVGAYGTGTFSQTGGSVNVGGYLAIGRFAGGKGIYNISVGSLTATAPDLIVGEQGTGSLSVSGSATINALILSVGHNGGSGTVTQTGGLITASNGLLLGSAAGGSGTFTLSGGTLSTPNVTQGAGNGTFYFAGGTLSPTASSASFMQGITTAAVKTGGAVIDTGLASITVAQSLVHDVGTVGVDGGLTKRGIGALTLQGSNSYSGPTSVIGGTLIVNSATALPTNTALSNSANVVIDRGATAQVTVSLSSMNNAGLIDLKDNRLIIVNATATTAGSVFTQLHNGMNGGGWNGPSGIKSSVAAGSPLYGVGEVLNSSTLTASYAYYGDANLTGVVDGSDYSLIDFAFASAGGLTGWQNGDFNYDGQIDGSDYSLIDNGFNRQGGQLGAFPLMATVASEVQTNLITAVPEPMVTGMAAVGLIFVNGRRRKRAACRG